MRQALWIALVLAAPTTALAQAAQALGSPVGEPDVPPPPQPAAVGVDPEILELRAEQRGRRPAHAASASASTPHGAPVSLGTSLGHAFGGLGIGAGAGYLVAFGAGVLGMCLNGGDPLCVLFSAAFFGSIGAAALAPLGAGLGAWGFGELSGGSGNAFAAIGGAYIGGGLAFALGYGIGHFDVIAGLTLGPIAGVILTTIGAAAGYQLSGGSRTERRPSPEVMVVPTVEAPQAGDGLVVGAAGAF